MGEPRIPIPGMGQSLLLADEHPEAKYYCKLGLLYSGPHLCRFAAADTDIIHPLLLASL
jgi:hypothetical protein